MEVNSLIKIPELKGESTLESWNDSLHASLNLAQIRHYILRNVPQPTDAAERLQWRKDRALAVYLITSSTNPVRQILKNNGWTIDEENPKTLYDIVNTAIPQLTQESVKVLVKQLGTIKRQDYTSMSAFIEKFTYLHRRMREMQMELPLKLQTWQLLVALEDIYPVQCQIWSREIQLDRLTLDDLKKELMRIHLSEVAENEGKVALASVRGQGQGQQQNKDKRDKRERWKARYSDSPVCTRCTYQHPTDWPICDVPGCDHCHPGGRDRCWILHPELNRNRKKSKDQLRGNQDNNNQSQRAAPSVSNFTSGLGGSNFTSGASMMRFSMANIPDLNKDTLIKDSGSNDFIFNDKKWFINLNKLPIPYKTLVADGLEVDVQWEGTAILDLYKGDGTTSRIELKGAQYSPVAPCNLISEGRLRADGAIFDPWTDKLIVKASGAELAKVHWKNNLCILSAIIPTNQPIQRVILSSLNYETMHKRLMHASKEVVLKACKDADIKLTKEDENFHCEACFLGKATDMISRESPSTLTGPGQLIRADLVFHEVGHLGYRYFVHFIDTWSGYHWVRFVREKHEAFQAVKDFTEFFEIQSGLKMQALGLDGGSEFGLATQLFKHSKLREWANKRGLVIKETVPYTPSQNGQAERAGRVILEKARSSMIQAKIPSNLWPFAVDTAVKITNLLPTRRNEGNISPQQKLFEAINLHESLHTPYIRHLRTFGCRAYVYIKAETRKRLQKMHPRARKGVLIGYDGLHGKIFWIWLPDEEKVVRANAVRFYEGQPGPEEEDNTEFEAVFNDPVATEDENTMINFRELKLYTSAKGKGAQDDESSSNGADDQPSDADDEPPNENHGFDDLITPEYTPDPEIPGPDTPGPDTPRSNTPTAPEVQEDAPIPPDNPHFKDASTSSNVAVRRSGRTKGLPEGYYKKLNEGTMEGRMAQLNIAKQAMQDVAGQAMHWCMTSVKAQSIPDKASGPMKVPKNYRQAKKSPDYVKFIKPAMDKQYNSLIGRHVWDLVDTNEPPLPGKWVYDQKEDADHNWKMRARWVVCGNFEDEASWSIGDLYAAVASSTSVKVFLAYIAILDLELRHFDFETAFLNSDIPKGVVVHVEQPHGFEDGSNRVCRLKKALYGLRRSSLWWFDTITPVLKDLGFEPFNSDLCLFKNSKTGVLILIYVDDLLISAPTNSLIDETAKKINDHYALKHLGQAYSFLGFEITRNRPEKKIQVSQKSYADKILIRYKYEKFNSVLTPWPSSLKLPAEWDPIDDKSYIKQTGALNYYSVGTRPDITYTVGKLCEANKGPSDGHLQLLKHLFRYIKGTTHFNLVYGGKFPMNNLKLHAYSDAAHGDNLPSRRSTGGYVIFLAGAPVLWKAKKQSIVTISSTEAEFINLSPTGQALVWVNSILKDLNGVDQEKPLILYTDSQNARANALCPQSSQRTRNIDIRFKWVIERVKNGDFSLVHVDSKHMVADGLTKALNKDLHDQFLNGLGMKSTLE